VNAYARIVPCRPAYLLPSSEPHVRNLPANIDIEFDEEEQAAKARLKKVQERKQQEMKGNRKQRRNTRPKRLSGLIRLKRLRKPRRFGKSKRLLRR
jgi:hypothetical protein